MIKHRLCKISIGMVLNLFNFVYIVIFHVEAGLENVKLAILERRFSDILQKPMSSLFFSILTKFIKGIGCAKSFLKTTNDRI